MDTEKIIDEIEKADRSLKTILLILICLDLILIIAGIITKNVAAVVICIMPIISTAFKMIYTIKEEKNK